ncbi:MAG: BrnT family toxin, partial [Gammaproteobacteria bacterium]|nr:BrnT family toxin [Gammaproteobacteria bacterium]
MAYKREWSSSGTTPRAIPVSRTAASTSSTVAHAFLNENRIVGEDRRWDYGEDRYRLLGAVEGRVFVVIYTMRGST